MINVGRIVNSRNFAQPNGYTVFRITGSWVKGRFVLNPEIQLQLQGSIIVASTEDLEQVPEGDRVTGMMSFYSMQAIYRTRAEDGLAAAGISDEIVWQGERYRIASVAPYQDFGYYKAIGARMAGD